MDHLEIINQYKNNRIGCVRIDKVIQYCIDSLDLETVIIRAVWARDENNRKHSHQKIYISDVTLVELRTKLLKIKDKIKNVNNFDELFELIYKTYVLIIEIH